MTFRGEPNKGLTKICREVCLKYNKCEFDANADVIGELHCNRECVHTRTHVTDFPGLFRSLNFEDNFASSFWLPGCRRLQSGQKTRGCVELLLLPQHMQGK